MRYKLFGKSGLRVSELCLGTMTFGTEWGWGADHETSKKIFDAYANAGGNFIDTANRYTDGTSERFVGEFVASDRDHFVLATKYSLKDRDGDPNFSGNHRKNMFRSVEASLKRMNVECIDVFWVHVWDFTTPMEEILRGLDDLVRMGKVHYIGISDTPAWLVSRANTLAELKNWTSFTGLQVEYSLLQRTPEADLLPMAKALDLAVTPWAPLAGGALTGKYLKGDIGRLKPQSARLNDRSSNITNEVVKIAHELDVSPAQVALRYIMQQQQVMVPIVGARKLEQITDCLKAVDVALPQTAFNALDTVSKIDLGFPHEFLKQDGMRDIAFGGLDGKIDNHRS